MKKAKAAGRIIIIFFAIMCATMSPTFMLRTGDEIISLLQEPGYWIWTIVLTAFITWRISQAQNNSNK